MQALSCFKGMAPIAMPDQWVDNFDPNTSFAAINGRARIRFQNGLAFEVWVEPGQPPIGRARALTPPEIEATHWGPFQPPWETWHTAELFGHGPLLYLHELIRPDGTPDYTATL